ncbi:sulfatase-like hydrolase/transferase [Bacteroidota bacterium]
MIIRLFYFIILLLCAMLMNAQDKPNVVFILADDLGWSDLHCYGHPYAETPSLDSLASQGTRFERFYVTGVTCNPSRTGFMTSRHPASYSNYAAEYGFGDKMTVSEIFKQNGYVTGHFGKWHIGPKTDINPVMDGIYGIDDIGVIGSDKSSDGGRDVDLFEEAMQFMETNKDKPFYVDVWGHITHYPVDPVASLVDNFNDVTVSRSDFGVHMQKQFDDCEALGGDTLGGNIEQSMRNYMGDVFGLDMQVGRLMDKLDELGIADNTILIFSSDQGPAPVIISSHEAQGKYEIVGDNTGVIPSQNMLGYAGGLRGGKHTQFEGGVRSPLIIRWPGKIPANSVNDTSIVSGLDYLPTLCSLAGISIDSTLFEGENIADVWLGSSRQRSTALFWRASSENGDPSMLEGNWKMHKQDSEYVLYDLSIDEKELNDVAQDNPLVVEEMSSKMADWVSGLPVSYQKDPATEEVYTYYQDPIVNGELLLHLDASVDSLVKTDANNVVTSWIDLSGNEYNALPARGHATYPSSKTFDNGLKGIDLRDSLSSLQLLSAAESDTILNQAENPMGFCIITTVYIDSIIGNWNDLAGNSSAVANGFLMRYGDDGNLQTSLAGVTKNGSGVVQPGQPVIFSFNYDAVNEVYHYWCSATDEELLGQVPPADFSNGSALTIGATTGTSRYFDGMLGEVLVYDGALTKNKRTEVIYELGMKWGVDLPRIPITPVPHIVQTTWSDADVAIVSLNAAEKPYNADKTGAADATAAIQAALDDCGNAPGGVVYLPEGTYRLDGNLVFKDGVTLRGDWKAPSDVDKSVAGTVLHIYGSKGEDSDDVNINSPILLGGSGGIRDLTIFYPEQDATNPIPYPYTIRCKSKLQTVMNVTLVNAYKGIRFETNSGSAVGHPNVYNVYGSPLRKGVRLNKAAAVPRIVGVYFDPAYWAESGLAGSPSEAEILNALRSLNSVAFEIEQSDNGIIGNIQVRGYEVAIGIGAGGNSSNMKVYDFIISECHTGINAVTYKSQGWTFTKGSIQVDGDGARAVNQIGEGIVTFNDVSFGSTDKLIVSTTGSLSFTNCHFQEWQDDYGIYMSDGNLLSFGNIFSKTLESGEYNIFLDTGIDAAAVSGNTFENSAAKIHSQNTNTNLVVIDTTREYEVYRHEYPSHVTGQYFKPAKEDTNSLFNVHDFGAVGDMETENSDAFKSALLAAAQYGGGTVYVPGGAYRIDGNLVIPTGVELRGVHDVPLYTGHGRSILLSYVNMENPGNTPFIAMNEGSGIRGLLIMRPQQVYNEADSDVGTTIYDWPYAIRAAGDNCHIVNISVANADKGIDLASQGGGHYINWYLTAPIRVCLNVQTGANPVVVDNMQTNPGLFRDIAKTMNWNLFSDSTALTSHFQNNIAPNASESTELYPSGTAANIKGDGAITFYSNFYNNPFNGFIINGSPTMKSYLSGGEGEIFYTIESEGNGPVDLEIIANTYHPIKTDPAITGFGSFQLKPNSSGIVKILNTTSFGDPNVGYRMNNGRLIIQSAFQTVSLQTFVEARGTASVSTQGNYLRSGISSFHGIEYDDSAHIDILGTYSENTYRVSSLVDVFGSTPNQVTRVDVIPPLKPLDLQGEPVSTSQIDLNWDQAPDSSDVAGYSVYRDGIKIASTVETNYSDTELSLATSYDYYIRAFDNAGNYSEASNTITVITLSTDVEKFNETDNIKVYPNPARDKVFISVPGTNDSEISFNLYSASGVLYMSEFIAVTEDNSEVLFDVSKLEEGLYIYQLINTDKIYTGKLYISK